MTWTAVILTLLLAVDLVTDYRLYLQKKGPNHKRGALLRLIGFIPAVWVGGWWAAGLVFTYWFMFDDIWMLLSRGYWVGKSAMLDKLQRRYPPLIAVKHILGITALVLFFTQ